jgi:hypothetical protein
MRFHEFKLSESQGGIFRRAQEVGQGGEVRFKHAENNNEISLVSAQMVPATGSFETEDEIDQGLQDYLKANGVAQEKTQFAGNPATARAGLVSIWKDVETEELMAFVKLVKKPGDGAAPVLQTNADFKKSFGYGAQGKTAQRQTLKLKPKDVIQSDSWLSATTIPSAVQSFIAGRADFDDNMKAGLVQLLQNITDGSQEPVAGMGQFDTSLEVDFGETAAPIALVTGNFVGGDYQAAEEGLLAPLGLTWASLGQVLFPSAGGEKIYDSYIKLDKNNNLKVSSKDKKGGAAASITGLVDAVTKTPEKYQDIFENQKWAQTFEILKTIASAPSVYWGTATQGNKGINGPLIIGVDTFKFITEREATTIVDLMKKQVRIHPDAALKQRMITSNLHSLIKVKGAKFDDPAYNLGYHLLACVAKNIANIVNKDASTSELFRAILERSNMVQVKTSVKKTGDGASFNQFTVIYPPIFSGTFLMIADNNYMATRKPIAPLSFAIK